MDADCVGGALRTGRRCGGRGNMEYDTFITDLKSLKPQRGKHRQTGQRHRNHGVKVQYLSFVFMTAYSIPKTLTFCFHESCGRASIARRLTGWRMQVRPRHARPPKAR